MGVLSVFGFTGTEALDNQNRETTRQKRGKATPYNAKDEVPDEPGGIVHLSAVQNVNLRFKTKTEF